MSPPASDSSKPFLLSELLRRLTHRVTRHSTGVLVAVLLSVVGSIVLTVMCMEFRTERSDLIDPSAEFHQRWTSYTQAFGDSSDMVVVAEAEQPEAIKAALEDLGAQLLAEPDRFSHVLFKVEPGALKRKGLQYLTPDQLLDGVEMLDELRPVITGGWNRLRLDLMASGLQLRLQSRLLDIEEQGGTPKLEQQVHDVLDQILRLAVSADAFVESGEFQQPWPMVINVDPRLQSEGSEVIYLMNDAGTIGFLKARPVHAKTDFNGATPCIDRLRELISIVQPRHPQVHLGLTGIPVLENDEMRRSQDDMIRASVISFVAVAVLLLVGFRGARFPLLAMLTLAVGMAWAFGFTTLVVGHLNILSVSFAAILIGLGIDFAIHYLARYLELRAAIGAAAMSGDDPHTRLPDDDDSEPDTSAADLAGYSASQRERREHAALLRREALGESSASVGLGIVTAAITTALAFFCASLTEFLGVAELGIIAGGGVLLCAIATFVVLPALATVLDQWTADSRLLTLFQGTPLRRGIADHPVLAAVTSVALSVWLGHFAFALQDGRPVITTRYDYNLLNLQADGLESVEVQRRIFHQAEVDQRPGQGSLLFAVSIANSADEARDLRDKFLKLPTVHHVEELASRLPRYSAEETKFAVEGFHSLLSNLSTELPPPVPVNPALVGGAFEQLLELLRQVDLPRAREAATAIDRFLDGLDGLETEQQSARLTEYQVRMVASLLEQLRRLRDASDPEPITIDDLPQELSSRFVSPDGRWLVQVYPANPVWDIEPLRQFVEELRTVDPEVTGTPLQNYEAALQIMQSYQNAALYALVAVALTLLIDFIGLRTAMLTILPSTVLTACIGAAQWMSHGALNHWILIGAFTSLVVSLAVVIDFRSVAFTILTLLPPVVGGVLMYGTLTLAGVDLNPANLIVLPLILGIGVDDGVHVVHDFRAQRGGYCMSASTLNAVVLTSLTSMIGFGSMMIAAHRGLYSLGLVLVIGVGECLFVSLVLLPSLLTLYRRWNIRRRARA